MADLAGKMNMIAALIAKAESTDFPEEAATYRAKAEELMARWRLEEEDLIRTSEGTILPVRRNVTIVSYASPFRHQYGWLFAAITRHVGVRYVGRWNSATQEYFADVFGYDIDIRLLELIYNAARLVFAANLEPEVDTKLSDQDNVYRLRSAGIARNRIAQMLWGADLGKAGHSAHAKVGALYRAACAERGEDAAVSGREVNAKTYREVYAREFVSSVERRLRVARDAADAAVGALVSVDRGKRVDEAFYAAYPQYRPQETPPEPTGKVKPAKPSKGLSKSDLAYFHRNYYGPTARVARRAGETAAEQVDLQRAPRATRVESTPNRPQELEN
jgi:hypothetical protein